MFNKSLDQMDQEYKEWLASQGKSPSKPGGKRGTYKYKKKAPSSRVVAMRERDAIIAAALATGDQPHDVPKEYDCGLKCPKCTSTMRYISSGSCSGCRKRLDLRTKEDIANGVEALNPKHQGEINRRCAKALGEKQYEGLPCKNCGCTQRYTISTGCVNCIKRKTDMRREKEASRFNHDSSQIMFIKRAPSLPEVYALCPNLAAFSDCTLIFTNKAKPKRLIGLDVMTEPYALHKIVGSISQKLRMRLKLTEEEQLIAHYISSEAMDLACKIYNRTKTKKVKDYE